MKMKKSVYMIFFLIAFFVMSGCNEEEYAKMEDRPGCVTLKINVNMADILPQTRADKFDDAENDDEKMRTLRIIIVRPNGRVERVKFMKLDDPATLASWKFDTLVSGENKQIYIIVNEEYTKIKENGLVGKVTPYDFEGIKENELFPLHDIYNLTISLNSHTEQLEKPLPMSDMHQVYIEPVKPDGKEYTISCDLTVRRAAVKFTYYVTNKSDKDFEVVGLEMEKMAREEYFLPREFEGDYFVVPSVNGNNEYYDFVHDFSTSVRLQAGAEKVALLQEAGEKPIYLLEGKYEDGEEDKENKDLNYRIALKLKNNELGAWKTTFEYFPNLPNLKRNTHVVVHATIQHDLELKWEVHVQPYISVPLEPDFGL